MTGLPTVQVLLDDGTGTFPYDITTTARVGYGVSRGRQDEASQVNPGKITLTLDNNDGRFTLGSTVIASPSPIKVDAKIRVKVTANAVTRDRFTGYVQQWPVEWPTGSDIESLVQVIATDAQARGERQPLRSITAEEMDLDDPSAIFTLGEPSGATTAADSSGNQAAALTQAGTGADVVFGSGTGPSTDGLTAATFAAGKGLKSSGLSLGVTPAFIFAFATTSVAGSVIFALDPDQNNSYRLALSAAGVLSLAGTPLAGGVAYNDGLVHVVALRMVGATSADVYIDGVLTNSAVATGVGAAGTQVWLGGTNGSSAGAYVGTIAQLAIWVATPSGARLIAESQAMLTGFSGESGTARITRLAGYAGLPIGTLDTSLTNVAFEDITGKSASAVLRDVADAELGLVFFDGSGNATFHNRNRPAAKTAPDITLTADVLEPGTAFQVDTQGLLNFYEVAAVGTKVTQVVRNTASETTHGRYPGSASYLVLTDAEALDRANWVVANHAEPSPRVGSLTIDLMSLDAATQNMLLTAEPNTWIRVTGLPSQTPGGTTADLVVQGFTEALTRDSWSVTFNVANRALFQAWILGDATYSVLGTTTRLYV